MKQDLSKSLSRRERQIMDIIYSKNSATVNEVMQLMPDRPSYSTVRALLHILEEKGYLEHENKDSKYIYHPIIPKKKAIKAVLDNLLATFFNNSAEQAVAALLENEKSKLTEDDLERLSKLIENARKADSDDG